MQTGVIIHKNRRTNARFMAVQMLYEASVSEVSLESLFKDYYVEHLTRHYDKKWLGKIISTYEEKADYLRRQINAQLFGRRPETLVMAILLIGLTEAVAYTELPKAVLVNEYTWIARQFYPVQPSMMSLVNALLDKLHHVLLCSTDEPASIASDVDASDVDASDVDVNDVVVSDVDVNDVVVNDVVVNEAVVSDIVASDVDASDIVVNEAVVSDVVVNEAVVSDIVASDVVASDVDASDVVVNEAVASDVDASDVDASDVVVSDVVVSDGVHAIKS